MAGLLPQGHAWSRLLTVAAVWLSAAGAAAETRIETHPAGGLTLANLAGDVRIEGHDRDDVKVVLEGTGGDLAAIAVERRGDTLYVDGGGGAGSTVHAGQVTVSARGGGRSTVRMGNWSLSAEGDETRTAVVGRRTAAARGSVTVTIQAPRHAVLTITRLIGDLVVQGVGGRVDLELVDGAAQLDEVAGGRLAVVGDAAIDVARASADLEIELRGRGSVRVAHARVDRLTITAKGAGDVQVGGSAAEAVIDASGRGVIRIARVEARPRVDVRGRPRVEVGNW